MANTPFSINVPGVTPAQKGTQTPDQPGSLPSQNSFSISVPGVTQIKKSDTTTTNPKVEPFLGSQTLGNAKNSVTNFFQKPVVKGAIQSQYPLASQVAYNAKPIAQNVAPVAFDIGQKKSPEQIAGDVVSTGTNLALAGSMLFGNEAAPAEIPAADAAVKGGLEKIIGKVATGGTAYGAAQGLATGLQNKQGVGGVVGSTVLGGVLGKGLEYAGGKVLDTIANWGKPAAVGEKSITTKLFGEEAGQRSVAKSDPIAKEFQAGKRTLADTGSKIKSAIKAFSQNGTKALNAVFDKLPNDIAFKSQDIVNSVNSAMEKVVGSLEKTSGAGANGLKNISDLITKTKFTPDEQKVVQNMVEKINSWTNNTPRGIAELRRVLYDQFNRGDGSLSDKVVRSVNNELKNLISSSSKEYGPALAKAVENIDKVNSATRAFIDRNGNIIESRIASFAKKLSDPALAADQKALMKQIFGDSFSQIEKELQGFNNYKILQKIKDPGIVKKAALAGGIIAGLGTAYEGVKSKLGL